MAARALMLVGTPHWAHDVAVELARIDGKTFDALAGPERDRYYEMAAWVTDEYVTGGDFHEGCLPESVAHDWEEEAFTAGYERAHEEVADGLTRLAARATTAPGKAALRKAREETRGTASAEAISAAFRQYRNERRAAERQAA